jgi:glycosyltransferase involved in cell wall biosynthesis
MKLRVLHISTEIRHELGCAASLKRLGFDVTYVHLGDKNEPLQERNVYTDQGSIKVNFVQITSPTLFQSIVHPQNFIPDKIIEEKFDLVVATSSTPFYIARYVARKQGIPIVLRAWGIRANKLIDHIIYGKNYSEVLNFYPSILHNLMQIWYCQAIVAMDDATKDFLRRLPLFKKLNIIYPTYAALHSDNDYEKSREIKELIKGKQYIFSIVTMSRTGPTFRLQELPQFKILYMIAKECPEVNVVIAGGTSFDARRKFGLSRIPKNLTFVGWISSDNVLKVLYDHASLVVIPIFFRSLSNRLLEALYYGRPTLTNSIAKLLHNKLEHLHHVFISDNYAEYPSIIKELFRNEALLEELASGAKEAYSSFFSARKCGLAMKHVIESVISNSS